MSRPVILGTAVAVSVVAVVGGVVAIATAGTGSDAAQRQAVEAAQPIPFDTYTAAWGILIGIQRRYSEDRDLSGGGVTIGGETEEDVSFWSRRYDDDAPAPDPYPVPAGTSVLIEATVQPDCTDPAAIPVSP